MIPTVSAIKMETEVKVRLDDREAFGRRLPEAGFRLKTERTLERNVLLDTYKHQLFRRGELLRIRQYGKRWILTHKAPSRGSDSSAHKVRKETETEIEDGHAMEAIFERLGYTPVFEYEKFRTEWNDGEGHIVVDETPIGDFAELEGESEWIDRVAAKLGIARERYLKVSYGQVFQEWKRATHSRAMNMTFAEIQGVQ